MLDTNGYKFVENNIYEFDKWTGEEHFQRVSVIFKEGKSFLPKRWSTKIITFYKRKDADPFKREQFFDSGLKFEPIKWVLFKNYLLTNNKVSYETKK